MADPNTLLNTSVEITSEPEPDEIDLHCPRCSGFCCAIEKPTHRLEQNVSFRVRLYCKRCNRKFHNRITFNETTPPPSQADA